MGRYICFAGLISVLVMVHAIGCSQPPHRPARELPVASNVVSIEAQLFGQFLQKPDTGPFEVPVDQYPALVSTLSPVGCGNGGVSGDSIGVIVITSTDGGRTRIEFPWSGQNPLAFTIDGEPCHRAGEYRRMNVISEESTAFFPDESLNLYHYLSSLKREMSR